jgi:hypothetical protein
MRTINQRRPDLRVLRQRAIAALAKRQATRDPTLDEISQACEAIQAGWTRKERRTRWLIAHSACNVSELSDEARRRLTPPELCCVDYCDG